MSRVALYVAQDFKIPIRGIDLGTLLSLSTWEPDSPEGLLERFRIQILNIPTFQNTWEFSLEEKEDIRVILRAWICAYAIQSEAFQKKLQEVTYVTVDTTWISKAERLCLAQLLRQSDVVRYSEEIEILAEFNKIKTTKDGYIAIKNARYKTQTRRGENCIVVIADKDGNKLNTGQVRTMAGRTSFVSLTTGAWSISKMSTVTVVGREDHTNAERARDQFVLHVLQGVVQLISSPFI
ncbi:hypothetical protein M422DRAFT_249735 [Sphaerobolus stellatus SS14]|uniref:Uncharacterized protein n=1 Tax=Sphaerobolus stellatus (strain SS14) TaxID=990650 RepID=A0A0C9VUH5_SPHS4|nr:hypothetical protein M422DRAFT_249735 [Sphaerobolus stellatus SS14]